MGKLTVSRIGVDGLVPEKLRDLLWFVSFSLITMAPLSSLALLSKAATTVPRS